jgi:hypothetical protein
LLTPAPQELVGVVEKILESLKAPNRKNDYL